MIDTQDNITSLTIVVGGAVDGNDEQIVVNGVPFMLGTNQTNTATSIGGVPVTMAFVGGTLDHHANGRHDAYSAGRP